MNPPANAGAQWTRVLSLGLEHPLEEEMATHSSILAWKIPWTEEPSRLYSPWGHKELDMTQHAHWQKNEASFKETTCLH